MRKIINIQLNLLFESRAEMWLEINFNSHDSFVSWTVLIHWTHMRWHSNSQGCHSYLMRAIEMADKLKINWKCQFSNFKSMLFISHHKKVGSCEHKSSCIETLELFPCKFLSWWLDFSGIKWPHRSLHPRYQTAATMTPTTGASIVKMPSRDPECPKSPAPLMVNYIQAYWNAMHLFAIKFAIR